MGREQSVAVNRDIALDELRKAFPDGMLAMIDGQLVMPTAPSPLTWREARFRFPAGMVTIQRRPGALALVTFGNADAALDATVARIAEVVAKLP
jgi:hypothetical protein